MDTVPKEARVEAHRNMGLRVALVLSETDVSQTNHRSTRVGIITARKCATERPIGDGSQDSPEREESSLYTSDEGLQQRPTTRLEQLDPSLNIGTETIDRR